MGHMYPSNISRFVNSHLNIGSVTITKIVDELERRKFEVSCAEARYTERHMLAWATQEVIYFLYDEEMILPFRMSAKQSAVFSQ